MQATIGDTVSPPCLPKLGDYGDESSFPAGAACVLTGWGKVVVCSERVNCTVLARWGRERDLTAGRTGSASPTDCARPPCRCRCLHSLYCICTPHPRLTRTVSGSTSRGRTSTSSPLCRCCTGPCCALYCAVQCAGGEGTTGCNGDSGGPLVRPIVL